MSYTIEDFRAADFAIFPKYGLRAHKSAGDSYWQRDGIKRTSNEEMLEAGWVPVSVGAIIQERDKAKEACHTLGKTIDWMSLAVLRATRMQHVIGADGDGDWEVVWDKLAEISGVAIFDDGSGPEGNES